jgi:hypothetical protein
MSFFTPRGPTIPSSGNYNDLTVNKLKTFEGGGGQPAGPNNSVQFNSNGSFDGNSNLTYSNGSLTVGNTILGSANLGFFGNSVVQQSADNNTLEEVLSLLRAYGLCKNLPWSQPGFKLVVTGSTERQGQSVSLSADGNTLAVGSPADSAGIGATWIFTRNAGVWTQQAKLVGTGYVGPDVFQGNSVSLSSDGNTLAVGASDDDNFIGATWIFTRTAGVWTQQGSKLVGTGSIGNAEQGHSVSISSDGNTLAVGGPEDDNSIGAAWIFTRTAGVWSEQIKLVASDYIDQSTQGYGVSLNSDGNILAVGGIGDDTNIGATWIFTRSAGVWTQDSKLVGSGAIGNASQGSSVSLSSDGNTLAVGGFGDNPGSKKSVGATWIFIRSSGLWSEQAKLVGTGYLNDDGRQGISVSLNSDGNTLAVGGNVDDNEIGATWIFMRSDEVWTQQGSKLVGPGYIGPPVFQGTSVSLSSDGTTLAVGGPGDDNPLGATWIFNRY